VTNSGWRDLVRRAWQAAGWPRVLPLVLPRVLPGNGRPRALSTDAALWSLAQLALARDAAAPTLQAACEQVLLSCGADSAAVVLLDEQGAGDQCGVVAAAGCAAAAIGQQFVLPLDARGVIVLPPALDRRAGAGWREPPLFTGQGLSASLWLPLQADTPMVGWLTAHARDALAIDAAARPGLLGLAELVGQALRRERVLRAAKQQALRARALCDALPALWLSIDSGDGRLVGCAGSLAVMLGYPLAECLGRPAVDLIAAPTAVAALDALRRPLSSGAELGVSFRLRHRDGSLLDCVADGRVVGGAGQARHQPPTLAWVFHELDALRWASRRRDAGAPADGRAEPADYEWTLEFERERRQDGLRLLAPLAQGLQALQAGFEEGLGEPAAAAASRAAGCAAWCAGRRSTVAQAWQSWQAAAIALSAPVQRATDLLAALEGLVRQSSQRSGTACALVCSAPPHGLCASARLAVYRVSRELLLLAIDASDGAAVVLQVQALAPASVQVRLLRRAQDAAGTRSALAAASPPAPRRGLGLFGVRTLLASVGGVLVVAPGQHDEVFSECRVPLAPGAPASAGPGIGVQAWSPPH